MSDINGVKVNINRQHSPSSGPQEPGVRYRYTAVRESVDWAREKCRASAARAPHTRLALEKKKEAESGKEKKQKKND